MALILTAHDLSTGKGISSVVTPINNRWRVSATTTGCKAKQRTSIELWVAGADGNYSRLYEEENQVINPIIFDIVGNTTKSISVSNVNATSGKVIVFTQDGATGTINIDSVVSGGEASIEDVELSVDELKVAVTDGSQKTQTVDPSGNFIYPSGTPVSVSEEITRPADTTAYTAGDAINTDAANVVQVDTLTLTGTAPTKQKETVTLTGTSGTAEITGVGGLTKTVTFATDLTTTASNFVTAFAADYLAAGVTLTSSTVDLIFESTEYGVAIVAPVITNVTTDLAGTVVPTTANVVVGEATISAAGGLTKTVTFDIAGAVNLTDTAAAFVTANDTEYATEGITLTSSGADLIFTSDTAGVPFTSPVITNTVGDLDGSVANTTPNTTLEVLEFASMATTATGGGILMDVKVETDITTFASQTIRLWIYNAAPATPLGDNVAFVNAYADKNSLLFFVDVEMEALNTGSDSVVGVASVAKEYLTATGSLFVALQSISAVTPTSGGKVNVTITSLKLS